LRLGSSGAKGQALVGRSLWEWMDDQDKAAFIAAVGICIFSKDAKNRTTLDSPPEIRVQMSATRRLLLPSSSNYFAHGLGGSLWREQI